MRENSLLKHRSRHVNNSDYLQWKYNSYDLRSMIHFTGVSFRLRKQIKLAKRVSKQNEITKKFAIAGFGPKRLKDWRNWIWKANWRKCFDVLYFLKFIIKSMLIYVNCSVRYYWITGRSFADWIIAFSEEMREKKIDIRLINDNRLYTENRFSKITSSNFLILTINYHYIIFGRSLSGNFSVALMSDSQLLTSQNSIKNSHSIKNELIKI